MSKLDFEGQREGEKLKFIFRRHGITARKGFFFLVIMGPLGLIPVFLWPGNDHIFWVWLAFLGVGVLGFAYAEMLWYYSVYIVTDQRLRQVVQKGLFKRTVVDLSLDKIETVAVHTPGLFGTIFNYGTIVIQTNVGDLTISTVKNPETVYNKLQNVIGVNK